MAALAKFFHQRLGEELERVYTEHKRLRVVSKLAPDAVNLELALTEVVFSRPTTNLAVMAAPVPGAGAALSATMEPVVAFAGRFTSPDRSSLWGTVADRRNSPFRPIDLHKLTVASSARDVVSQWARELAEAIEFDRLKPVERSPWFYGFRGKSAKNSPLLFLLDTVWSTGLPNMNPKHIADGASSKSCGQPVLCTSTIDAGCMFSNQKTYSEPLTDMQKSPEEPFP